MTPQTLGTQVARTLRSGRARVARGPVGLARWTRPLRLRAHVPPLRSLQVRHWLAQPGVRRAVHAFIVIKLIAIAGGGTWLVIEVARRLPSMEEIADIDQMKEATVVYDAFGQPAFRFFREQRIFVPLERVSPYVQAAVISVEDRRFRRHGGLDLVRIGGAAVANLSALRIVQGASTITQQLARVSLLTRDRTLRRKLAEAITAIRIEHAYSKDRILELYLNRVYFGDGFHGIEAAARGYFGEPAADLTLGEAALLAGLIQAPGRYAPTADPDRALARREVVLEAMLAAGAARADEVERARREPLALRNAFEAPAGVERNEGDERDDTGDGKNGLADGAGPDGRYFRAEVRRQLLARFGAELVFEGGLQVDTTFDPRLQMAAEAATTAGLARLETLRRARGGKPSPTGAPVQIAFIALDPQTGEVRALVGGRDFGASPFNRATQAHRQPGSAFKPILFAAALDTHRVTATTTLEHLDDPVLTPTGAWLPADGHEEATTLTVRAALEHSSNRGAVRLLETVGLDRTADYAARFGLGEQPRVPSVALGAGSVTLERLTAAYGAFANHGVVPQPTYITRVRDAHGRVLFEAAPDAPPDAGAIAPATAFVLASLLRGVIDRGTGARVRREGFQAPAAGKTGTTDDFKDAWFIGFTPTLAAGVWIGFDEPRTIMPGGYASELAAPVWARFMIDAVDSTRSSRWLERPADVVPVSVCALTGAVSTGACPATSREFFTAGTQPTARCPIHQERLRAWPTVLAVLQAPLAPFRRPTLRHAPPAQLSVAAPTQPAAVASLPVVHDHVFGHCTGRLIATADGLRYVTTHRDAFAIPANGLAQVRVEARPGRPGRVNVRTRQGRSYNFEIPPGSAGEMDTLRAVLEHQS